MHRYAGEPLGDSPSIAVIANDAIGNFVVATPLLQMLRERHPRAEITYMGGLRTAELEVESDLFDRRIALHSVPEAELPKWGALAFDWVINVEGGHRARRVAGELATRYLTGPAEAGGVPVPFGTDLRSQLWEDKEWTAPDLSERYPFLGSGFIAELFCRLSYLEGPIPRYRVPMRAADGFPPILVAMSASLENKLWPAESWTAVLKELVARGFDVGLVGAKPNPSAPLWLGSQIEETLVASGTVLDLRGRYTLPEVAWGLSHAKLVLTLDNGILHLAAAGQAPVVGLYRQGIHRLWAPPRRDLAVLTAREGHPVESIGIRAVLEAAYVALGV